MTEYERELDLMVGDLQRDNKRLRRQLQGAVDEALHLRHAIQHIYARSMLALEPRGVVEHDDKDSY